jgi:hypothetical protein
MSQPSPRRPAHPIRNFFRGLGEITEFLRESALALIEVAIGRWPKPFGEPRRRPRAPDQGLGPIGKSAPFPVDD